LQRRALVLVNRNSRRGAESIDRALAMLEAGGIRLCHEECRDAVRLSEAITQHARDIDLVVLGGGDGTINGAAPGLIESGRPFGLLPLGTANDLAHTLDIPPDLDAATKIILDGHLREIDIGKVNERYFFNVASLGLSSGLTRALTPEVKRRWGRMGYAIATFRALFANRPFHAEIVLDGKTRRIRTMQISVGNGVYYGGGLKVEENAAIDDGKLDLYSLEVASLWRLALIYPAFRRGRHGIWREVRTLSGGEIEIRTSSPRSINTDGELTTSTPATFRVLPRAIKVLAPRPSSTHLG
jgi:diacylglycerol kinase (ATP)